MASAGLQGKGVTWEDLSRKLDAQGGGLGLSGSEDMWGSLRTSAWRMSRACPMLSTKFCGE